MSKKIEKKVIVVGICSECKREFMATRPIISDESPTLCDECKAKKK